MKNYLKSKFFYIITVLTLAAVIIPTVLCSMGLSPVLRSAVNTLLTPLQKLSNKAVDVIDGYASYFYAFDNLVEENEALKKELSELKNEVYQARDVEEKYEWLSEYLELKMQHNDYKMMPAAVTGRESGNYKSVYMLDTGTSSGISRGMPVVSSDGLLGYISEAGPNWSKVTLLIESSSSTGAYDERSGTVGIVEGDFALASDGLCKLTYLDENADVKEGDRILTSGYGSIYPRSLVIGYVESIEQDEFSRGITAYVRPAAKFDQISEVMVITEYETYTE